ncbi:11603_t:CDS:2, partial [Racocetra fulgida]
MEILPLVSDTEIDNTTFSIQDLTDFDKIEVDELIINIVLDEQRELEEGDASNTDEEPPEIPIIEGLNGLKKFI